MAWVVRRASIRLLRLLACPRMVASRLKKFSTGPAALRAQASCIRQPFLLSFYALSVVLFSSDLGPILPTLPFP